MHLTPHEIDKLLLHQAGVVAQKRLARGLRLNYPEAVALIATQILEFIRDGKSVAELMDLGRQFLGKNQVMDGVAADVGKPKRMAANHLESNIGARIYAGPIGVIVDSANLSHPVEALAGGHFNPNASPVAQNATVLGLNLLVEFIDLRR